MVFLRSVIYVASLCDVRSGSLCKVVEVPNDRIAVEIKASFTEDLVEQLNQTIFQQQQQIDALIREVSQLRQQAPDGGSVGFRSLRDELPPHY